MKKMWKKVVAAALSMTLVLAMGIAVNAAESPSATPSNPGQETPTPSNPGQDTGKDNGQTSVGSPSAPTIEAGGVKALTEGVWVRELGSVVYDSNEQLIKSDAGIKEILGNNYKKGTTLELLAYVDIFKSGAGQVQVAVNKVSKGDTIYVLHYKVDTTRTAFDSEVDKVRQYGEWEVITPDAVGDGTVTFTCDSFSPFAFVKATSATPAKTPAATGTNTNKKNTTKKTSTTAKKSPKTGEF